MRTIHLTWCRLVTVLIVIVVIIQIINFTFLAYLKHDLPKTTQVQITASDRAEKVFEAMSLRIDQDNAVIDNTGEYRLFQNIWFGKSMRRDVIDQDVSIVTHCSVNNMYRLLDMSRRWEGPMSVVIFAPGQDLIVALENILQLVWCVLPIRTHALFHIVSPLSMPARDIKPYLSYVEMVECRFIDRRMRSTLNIENYGFEGLNYPNNLLRNFGLQSSMTEYVYVLDVDLVPSVDLRLNFLEFARTHRLMSPQMQVERPSKIAFVTPVFETRDDYSIPDVKSTVTRLYNRTIRQFYVQPCPQCQRPTQYDRWIQLPKTEYLEVAYPVQWTYPYEPFYITHRSVPLYNPNFKQYGFNRISQVR